MENMSVSKARNILNGKKLNYSDLYHNKYINSNDKIISFLTPLLQSYHTLNHSLVCSNNLKVFLML